MDKLFHWFWDIGVFHILYLLLAIVTIMTANWIIQAPLKEKVNQWQYRYRLRRIRTRDDESSIEFKNPFFKHIYFLVRTTSKGGSGQDVIAFVFLTVILFLFTFVMAFINFSDIFFSVIVSMLVAAIPYMIIHIRLVKLRYVLGEGFLSFIQLLSQSYSVNHHDIYHSLVDTQKHITNKELRQVILKLINDLQTSKNEEELRFSVNLFIYTAGSSWAKRLGNIIIKSYLQNENVMQTLMVLTRQIEETEEMLEQEQSTAMDSVFNGYLTIPIFILSIVLGYFVTGPQDWFSLQFGSQWPLSLFILGLIGVVFSVLISIILARPKNDI